MYSATNGLVNEPGSSSDEIYFFAGWSFGFKSKYQRLTPDSQPSIKKADDLDYDAYVYKYALNENSTSQNMNILAEDISKSDMRRRMTLTGQSSIDNEPSTTFAGLFKIVSLFTRDDAIPKERKQNYFIPYVSRYSGGFTTLESMKIPRASAYISMNLTGVEYYRG